MTSRDLRIRDEDLDTLNERVITFAHTKTARRRLKHARKNFRIAAGRGNRAARLFAGRELVCAMAEAEEWGVIGSGR